MTVLHQRYAKLCCYTLLLASPAVFASATEDDYEPCKAKALLSFQHCLASQHGNSLTIRQCWPDNQQQYLQCVSEVSASYAPNPAKQKAMQEMKKAQQQLQQQRDAEPQGNN